MRLLARVTLCATLAGCATPNRPPAVPAPSSSSMTRLRIIGTGDFHGALEARPDASGRMRGGAGAFGATVNRAKAECVAPACEWILLDGGDEFQGTPASNLAYGRPVSEIFNRLGYTAAALGNHEWDWGRDTLRARMAQQRYRVLGANIRQENGQAVPWIRSDTMIVRGGMNIGVIGLATQETPTSTKAEHVRGLVFLNPAPVVDSLARALRQRGAAFVVVVGHLGASCTAAGVCTGEAVTMAQRLRERVDAIVGGHIHTFVKTEVNGIPLIEAGSKGQAVGVIDLDVARHRAITHEVRNVFTDSIAPDPIVQRIADAAIESVAARVNRPVATIAEDMRRQGADYPLGKLIADAWRSTGHADFGAMNRGGVRADLRKGPATYGDLFEVSPFANYLYRVTARGAAMRSYFEKYVSGRPRGWLSGVVLTYDTTRAAGARITSIELPGGRRFSDDSVYTIGMLDFMVTGGDDLGFSGSELKSEPLNIVDLDALVDYITALPQPVVPPKDVRLKVRPWP